MVFERCPALTSIDVSSDNQYYKSVGGVLYNKAGTLLIECPGGLSGPLVIPDGVRTIDNMSFYQCLKLTAVTMLGWCRPAAAFASRSKRANAVGSPTMSGRRTFSATVRPRLSS